MYDVKFTSYNIDYITPITRHCINYITPITRHCHANTLTLYDIHYITPITRHCHTNILPSTGQENNTAQPKTDKWFSFPSHFSSFNCCLSVVLQLDEGDYPENLRRMCFVLINSVLLNLLYMFGSNSSYSSSAQKFTQLIVAYACESLPNLPFPTHRSLLLFLPWQQKQTKKKQTNPFHLGYKPSFLPLQIQSAGAV